MGFQRILFLVLFLASGLASAGSKFNNPGGMWMPAQIAENAELLRSLGLEIDASEISDPTANVLNSIVHLEYCSGSFISPNGLIITNWHCVQSILNYLTAEDRKKGLDVDHVKHGFKAMSLQEERNAGPRERILVTRKYEDVTNQVLAGVNAITDPVKKMDRISRRIKEITASAEAGKKNIRVEVKSFYRGTKYYLIERLELKDIRLVYAPPEAMGFFGGYDDNFRYPRHATDFAILRAYVSPTGEAAEYSAENVPFQPQNFLKVSAKGVKKGDLVLLSGFPGETERLNTSHQVERQIHTVHPLSKSTLEMQIESLQGVISILDRLKETDEEVGHKVSKRRYSLMNVFQNRSEALRNLRKLDFYNIKKEFEVGLQNWIDESEERKAKYGNFFAEMEKSYDRYYFQYLKRTRMRFFISQTSLFSSAYIIERMARSKKLADLHRPIGFQERDWTRLKQGETTAAMTYHREIDLEVGSSLLEESVKEAGLSEWPIWLSAVINRDILKTDLSNGKALKQALREQLENYYLLTQLEDVNYRLKLMDASSEEVEANQDSMLKVARKLHDEILKAERVEKTLEGSLLILNGKYMEAMREYLNRPFAPDANNTLRVTFGLVKGYTDPDTGRFNPPFTTVSQMLARAEANRDNKDFALPLEVARAYASDDHGLYADADTGEIPVNLVANVDTRGGNSGSAVLNSRGELVALNFDGTRHSMFRDWLFMQNNRSVFVDIRYSLWLLDKVFGMKRLIDEMKIDYPSCEEHLLGRDDHRK